MPLRVIEPQCIISLESFLRCPIQGDHLLEIGDMVLVPRSCLETQPECSIATSLLNCFSGKRFIGWSAVGGGIYINISTCLEEWKVNHQRPEQRRGSHVFFGSKAFAKYQRLVGGGVMYAIGVLLLSEKRWGEFGLVGKKWRENSTPMRGLMASLDEKTCRAVAKSFDRRDWWNSEQKCQCKDILQQPRLGTTLAFRWENLRSLSEEPCEVYILFILLEQSVLGVGVRFHRLW